LAYGLDKEKQDQTLHEMDELMFDMRVHSSKHNRKCLMPFQKDILLTNKSLRNLFSDVNEM